MKNKERVDGSNIAERLLKVDNVARSFIRHSENIPKKDWAEVSVGDGKYRVASEVFVFNMRPGLKDVYDIQWRLLAEGSDDSPLGECFIVSHTAGGEIVDQVVVSLAPVSLLNPEPLMFVTAERYQLKEFEIHGKAGCLVMLGMKNDRKVADAISVFEGTVGGMSSYYDQIRSMVREQLGIATLEEKLRSL